MSDIVPTDAEVLDKIEAFIATHRLRPTTFGRLAVGDGNLVQNLKSSRSITLKTGRRIMEFMAEYPTRPSKTEAA